MKLSRRKAIGAMVGGVAAAPEAIKGAGETFREPYYGGEPNEASNYYEASKNSSSQVDLDWLSARRKELEDQANGIFDGVCLERIEESRYHVNNQIAQININSLVSVSNVNKQRMLEERRFRNERLNYIKSGKRQLALFLKQHGLV